MSIIGNMESIKQILQRKCAFSTVDWEAALASLEGGDLWVAARESIRFLSGVPAHRTMRLDHTSRQLGGLLRQRELLLESRQSESRPLEISSTACELALRNDIRELLS